MKLEEKRLKTPDLNSCPPLPPQPHLLFSERASRLGLSWERNGMLAAGGALPKEAHLLSPSQRPQSALFDRFQASQNVKLAWCQQTFLVQHNTMWKTCGDFDYWVLPPSPALKKKGREWSQITADPKSRGVQELAWPHTPLRAGHPSPHPESHDYIGGNFASQFLKPSFKTLCYKYYQNFKSSQFNGIICIKVINGRPPIDDITNVTTITTGKRCSRRGCNSICHNMAELWP